MFRKLGLAAALAAALLAGSSTARAEDALAKAKALFDIGAKQYDAGQYKQAIRSFEEAYALSKRPGLLFSLGQAHKKQYFFDRDPVHLKAAIESYRQYLKGDAPRKAEASAAIKELEPYELKALAASGCVPCVGPQTPPKPGEKPGDKPGEKPGDKPGDKPPGQPPGPEPQGGAQLSIACEVDGATVVIDGGQPIPLPTQVEVTPGKHKLKIQAQGYEDYEREVTATGGIAPVIADLEPKAARLHIDAAAGAEILVDGKVVTKTPMKGAALIPPGRHVVSVLASGHYGWNEEIVLGKDEEKKVKIQLKTTAQRYAAWGIGAGGLASLAVGAVFTGLALVEEGKAQKFLDVQQNGNASLQQLREYQDALDARRDFAAGAVIGYGVAGVALVSSLVLLTTDKPSATLPAFKLEEPKEKRPKGEKMEMGMLPIVTPTFGGLGLVGKF